MHFRIYDNDSIHKICNCSQQNDFKQCWQTPRTANRSNYKTKFQTSMQRCEKVKKELGKISRARAHVHIHIQMNGLFGPVVQNALLCVDSSGRTKRRKRSERETAMTLTMTMDGPMRLWNAKRTIKTRIRSL